MDKGDLEAGMVKCPGCGATWHWVMGDARSMVCPSCGGEIPRPAEEGGGFKSWLADIDETPGTAAPTQEVSVEDAMRVLRGEAPVGAPQPQVEGPPQPEPEPEPKPEPKPQPEPKKVEPAKVQEKAPSERPSRPVPLPQGISRPVLAPRAMPIRPPEPKPAPPSAPQKPTVRRVRVWTAGAKALVFLLFLAVLGAGAATWYFYWMWKGAQGDRKAERISASNAGTRARKLEQELGEAKEQISKLSLGTEELNEKLAGAMDEARSAVGKELGELQADLVEKSRALEEAKKVREELADSQRKLQMLLDENKALQRTASGELKEKKRLERRLARIERAAADISFSSGGVELRDAAAHQAVRLKELTAELEKTARVQKRGEALPKLIRGVELLTTLDAADAREALESAVEAERTWPEANLYLGFALYRLGEDDLAVEAFKGASALGPRAEFHMGEVRYSAGDERRAAEAWERGGKGEGPFAGLCSSNLALLRADAYRATDMARAGLREGASWEARVVLARALLALGGKKNLDEAGKNLHAATEAQRWDPRPFVALGELRLRQKKAKLASEAGNSALKLRPSSVEARILLAKVSLLRGRKDEALKRLTEAIGLRPNSVPARIERARLLASSGRLDAALRDLDAALKSSPANVDALVERARVRGKKRMLKPALEDAARAAKMAPKRIDVHILRGDLLSESREYVGALGEYRSACSLDRLNLDAARRLVGLLLQEGTPVRDLSAAVHRAQEMVQMTSQSDAGALTLLAKALFVSGDAAQAARVQRKAFTISSRREHWETMKEYEQAAQKK